MRGVDPGRCEPNWALAFNPEVEEDSGIFNEIIHLSFYDTYLGSLSAFPNWPVTQGARSRPSVSNS